MYVATGPEYCQTWNESPVKGQIYWSIGIFSDSNKIFLCHESEDTSKNPKFQLIPILSFPVKHDHVCFIAPIDYCVE